MRVLASLCGLLTAADFSVGHLESSISQALSLLEVVATNKTSPPAAAKVPATLDVVRPAAAEKAVTVHASTTLDVAHPAVKPASSSPTTLDVSQPKAVAKAAEPVSQAAVAHKTHTLTKEEKIDALERQAKGMEEILSGLKEQHKKSVDKSGFMNNKVMSEVDKKMWKSWDEWDQHSYDKTRVGAVMVISKLKNAIHFLKKGDEQGLLNVIEGMKDMQR
mmetsp:Transcript_14420/g.32810  ORF Transcript_14420/g.32810 Transcript_14420/m.32810 type:complete len:219 (+) Transcript_14420:100-756(+)